MSNSDTSACNGSAIPELPRAPNPHADDGVIPRIESPPLDKDGTVSTQQEFDVATMDALVALKLLSKGVQALSEMTGDVPPTPAISRPATPVPRQLMEEILRRGSASRPGTPPSSVPSNDIRAPTFQRVDVGSPEALMDEPTVIADGPSKHSNREQSDAIARRFFSKRPPPVSIDDYLLRLHRYCPMSTAVYLAAGVYIHRMAVEDRSVPVTARTVHRLLLGTLRVAMKALEDLSYPHQRFAGVGGVSEKELAKLEISVCYLTNFDLKVDNPLLHRRLQSMQRISNIDRKPAINFHLTLPTRVARQPVEAV